MQFEALKVGELARRTGLTVRTLHHYDEIGLLKPSLHTESGHRLYTADDVARLQQVLSLRFVSDLSSRQVATLLGKNEGAIRALQFRALGRLRKLLRDQA